MSTERIATVVGGIVGPFVGVALVFLLAEILVFFGPAGDETWTASVVFIAAIFLLPIMVLVGFAAGLVAGARLDDRRKDTRH